MNLSNNAVGEMSYVCIITDFVCIPLFQASRENRWRLHIPFFSQFSIQEGVLYTRHEVDKLLQEIHTLKDQGCFVKYLIPFLTAMRRWSRVYTKILESSRDTYSCLV